MNIKELQKDLAEAISEAEKAADRRGKLQEKKMRTVEILEQLDRELIRAESAKNDAMTSFARDQAIEKDIEAARSVFEAIKKKREESAELLGVLEREFASIADPNHYDSPFRKAIVSAEAALWRPIAATEAGNAEKLAGPALLRAYHARNKANNAFAGSTPVTFQDFIAKIVFPATFYHEARKESAGYEAEILAEYL